jgi:hypothetical protein
MISRCRARTHEPPARASASGYTSPPETPDSTDRLHISKLAGALEVTLPHFPVTGPPVTRGGHTVGIKIITVGTVIVEVELRAGDPDPVPSPAGSR